MQYLENCIASAFYDSFLQVKCICTILISGFFHGEIVPDKRSRTHWLHWRFSYHSLHYIRHLSIPLHQLLHPLHRLSHPKTPVLTPLRKIFRSNSHSDNLVFVVDMYWPFHNPLLPAPTPSPTPLSTPPQNNSLHSSLLQPPSVESLDVCKAPQTKGFSEPSHWSFVPLIMGVR